jgi:uncharacterized membrane protein
MGLGSALLIVGVSAAPIAELRGGIPLAISLGYPASAAYLLAVFGNLLVVPILLVGLRYGEELLLRWRPTRALLRWLFARTRRKGRLIERVGPVALVLLVAIPLPGTGAWTGAIAARLFGIPTRKALPWIGLGVLIAGLVVLLVSLGLFELFGIGQSH